MTINKGKNYILGGPGPPSSPSATSPSSSRGAIATMHPTLVSLKNVRTASVALSSPKVFLTEGALGCFRPHALPISCHTLLP